ncbi:MAG: hypothetical protein IPM26_13570 [Saprospiraceae bacterium]|jgi:hypothetical protein|nr:hypothetical protein [Saprospiraceae bacterium]
MKHAYTESQLLRFYYKECDLFERLEIEFALAEDSTLCEDYKAMCQTLNELPKAHFSPKKKTLDAILAYSNSEV